MTIEDYAKKIKSFSDEKRIKVMGYLYRNGESSIDEMIEDLGMKYSNIYSHLNDFKDAGLVTVEKRGGRGGKKVYSPMDVDIKISKDVISSMVSERETRGIIFDIDDTLVRRKDIPENLSEMGREAVREAKRHLFEEGMSIDIPPEELFSEEWITSKYGNPVEWYLKTWLEVAGVLDNEIKKELITKYKKRYYERIEDTAKQCTVFPDVKPALEYLSRRDFLIGAHSNSSKEAVRELFKEKGILNYFYHDGEFCLVGGDERSKSPEAIEKVMSLLNLEEDECYMIGDSANDLRVAREAGIASDKTIAVYREIYPLENLKAMSPSPPIVDNFGDLVKEITSEKVEENLLQKIQGETMEIPER